MSLFVLVHGSWHEGSAWAGCVRHLESQGHIALAPSMAGHGKGANRRGVDHAQCARSIVEYILGADLSDFVLVGHSFGGTIISKVAEQLPERIRRLVFWNAFVLEDGHSIHDEIPPWYRQSFDELAAASPDNSITMPFPIWRDAFINDADLELAKSAYAQLAPTPNQPFHDKLDLKRFYSLDLPRSYLNCTEDIALPPGEWGWHPRMSSRLGLYRLVQMPGSHEALFTNPALLAEKIIEAGRD